SEVSKKYEISPDTLRYYERIGLIPKIYRNGNGIREYTEEDCRWIEFVKCMRGAGIQVEALIEYIKLFQEGDSTIEARKKILIEQRDHLIDNIEKMQKALERLNFKIKRYETRILPVENSLKPF
ncbi:MAG TPA: MerR family transcriptional regulator, partial [bacterium]|nr:MerR family transcriptional regulator [bacterium]